MLFDNLTTSNDCFFRPDHNDERASSLVVVAIHSSKTTFQLPLLLFTLLLLLHMIKHNYNVPDDFPSEVDEEIEVYPKAAVARFQDSKCVIINDDYATESESDSDPQESRQPPLPSLEPLPANISGFFACPYCPPIDSKGQFRINGTTYGPYHKRRNVVRHIRDQKKAGRGHVGLQPFDSNYHNNNNNNNNNNNTELSTTELTLPQWKSKSKKVVEATSYIDLICSQSQMEDEQAQSAFVNKQCTQYNALQQHVTDLINKNMGKGGNNKDAPNCTTNNNKPTHTYINRTNDTSIKTSVKTSTSVNTSTKSGTSTSVTALSGNKRCLNTNVKDSRKLNNEEQIKKITANIEEEDWNSSSNSSAPHSYKNNSRGNANNTIPLKKKKQRAKLVLPDDSDTSPATADNSSDEEMTEMEKNSSNKKSNADQYNYHHTQFQYSNPQSLDLHMSIAATQAPDEQRANQADELLTTQALPQLYQNNNQVVSNNPVLSVIDRRQELIVSKYNILKSQDLAALDQRYAQHKLEIHNRYTQLCKQELDAYELSRNTLTQCVLRLQRTFRARRQRRVKLHQAYQEFQVLTAQMAAIRNSLLAL
jgi:hypothetical protein